MCFWIQLDRIRWFETMRDWKEIAEFLHREVCMNFREFAELEFYCFWKRETVCLWNLKLATCEFVFVWFSFMWTVICGVCCRCRAFMLATVDLMTCLRVTAETTLTSWPFHVCISCTWQLFVLLWLLIHQSFCAVFHGMETHGCFDQKSFQLPMEWDWRNGFKIRWGNWLKQLCVLYRSQF